MAPVQTFIAQRVTYYLQETLNTHVSVKKVHFHFFDRLELEEFVVLDQYQDTLMKSGVLEVNLNNWFFLSKEIVIQDLSLQNAQVFLKRHQDTDKWNYQFILDKLIKQDSTKSGGSTPELQLRKLALSNTKFSFIDEWVGTDYYAQVGNFLLDGEGIDYKNKAIQISAIEIEETTLGILEYTGGRPAKKRKPRDINKFSSTPFNIHGWTVKIDDLEIQKSRFYLEYPETKAPVNFFDENHLDISDINTVIDNIAIVGDTIRGAVKHLKAKERSGLTIQEFKSNVTVSPVLSECKNLYLRTNNSEIKEYYAMHYRHFPDFLDYINRVKMVGNFKDAKIGINDILYFTDAIERIKDQRFYLSGKAEGPVSSLVSNQLVLTDQQNKFTGDFAIHHIPNVDQMQVVVKQATIVGHADAMMKYMPEMINHPQINVAAFGNFNLQGRFNGVMDDFVTNLKLNSSVGNIATTMRLKNAMSGTIAYEGELSTEHLAIGQIVRNKDWQNLDAAMKISGIGVSPEDATHINFDINIPQVGFKEYNYHNAHIQGLYQDEVFKGNAVVKDSNFNVAIENGQLYFRNKKAVYNLDATIHHVNTKALNWTDHFLTGEAEVNLNFTGKSIDDFLGSVLVYNMEMKVNEEPIKLNQFYLSSTVTQQQKTLNFLTNGIDARISGDFELSTLSQSFKHYFGQYFPEYFKAKDTFTTVQNFVFNITTKQTDDFFKLINFDAQLGAGAEINGKFNSIDNLFTLDGTIPYANFHDVNFKKGIVKVWGDEGGLKQNLALSEFNYQDYEIASQLHLDANIINNYGDFTIKTESVNTLGNAEIVGNITGRSDSFFVNIEPSSVLFNHKKWDIASPNTIAIAPNYLDVRQVELVSGAQKIGINGRGYNHNNLFITLTDVEANPINNLLHFTDFYVHGKVDGNIHVKDVFQYQDIDYTLAIDTLYVDQIKYGHLYATGTANLSKSLFTILPPSAIYSDWGEMNMNIQANYSKAQPSIKGQLSMEDAPVNFIYPFTKEHIEEPQGTMSAQVQLQGDFYDPSYSGKISFSDVKVKPRMTGVNYYIDHQELKLERSELVFNDFEVRDGLYNKGKVNGAIISEGWDNYFFNLTLNSDRLQVLSLDKYDNSYYYGQITAATTVNLHGRWNNLKMNIVGKPLANSKLIIPIASGGDYSQYEYITFKKKDEERKVTTVPDFNYHLRIDAIATPDLEAIIILDEATGDKLQAKGNGNLVLDMPSNGEMTLTGNYVIEEGGYNFAFKQLEVLNYKKNFVLEQGSIIKWSGNPYDADLAVRANTQVKARLYDLIMNESDRIGLNTQEITDAQLPQFINIHLDMNGALSKPQLTFKLDLVENRSIGTYAYQKLQRVNTNERELLNQVTGLLLLNQFLPPDGLNNSSISAGAITNMSELLSSTASSQISNFANKLLGVEDLIINLKYKNYALSGMDPNNPGAYLNRNEAGLNVRKNFFNDRLVTEVGGVYDWGNRNTNYNLAGEFRIQYLLTKDGRIRLNAFRTSNYDAVVQQNIARQGGGLLFKRSFSSLYDFFKWTPETDIPKSSDTTLVPVTNLQSVDTNQNEQKIIGKQN